jgi:metallo-beta-lactamase family protein
MKIKIIGAAGGEVTGSAYIVQTRQAGVLVDAGMFQGGKQSEVKNRLPSGARPSQLDAVLLTHAHLDHTGRVPLLIKHGYTGPIFATRATLDLAEIILKDAAKIQLQDAERTNRSRQRMGKEPVDPLYGRSVEPFPSRPACSFTLGRVAEGITARWVKPGHMLGSGSIELAVEENGTRTVVVFSGDLGPSPAHHSGSIFCSWLTWFFWSPLTGIENIGHMQKPWPSSRRSSSGFPEAMERFWYRRLPSAGRNRFSITWPFCSGRRK